METSIFQISYENITKGLDPEIDSWFLMETPLTIVSILVFYLMFVLKIGPDYMENKKPFKMKNILVAYNAYQVLFSLWLVSKIFFSPIPLSKVFFYACETFPEDERHLSVTFWNGVWWWFFSKVIDLMDTVFFVLRKKQSQVTFLHIYHHTITVFFSWCYLKYTPGEQVIFLGWMNSLVHVVMYFYYMMSAMGPEYQKYLWWKKYMTRIQIIQFCIMIAYLITTTAMGCKMPMYLVIFFTVNCIIFLYLFGSFYVNAYKKKSDDGKLNKLKNSYVSTTNTAESSDNKKIN